MSISQLSEIAVDARLWGNLVTKKMKNALLHQLVGNQFVIGQRLAFSTRFKLCFTFIASLLLRHKQESKWVQERHSSRLHRGKFRNFRKSENDTKMLVFELPLFRSSPSSYPSGGDLCH